MIFASGKSHKKILSLIICTAMFFSIFIQASAATVFKDLPSTHWAYQAITRVTEKGIMSGDSSGNFKPDGFIDKFETSRILAIVAGYKTANATASEQAQYESAYEKNKNFLSQFSKAFTRWNSTVTREIAFLLEKEILTSDDLNQFVIKDANGTEQLRALSRQEVAVFLVKLMGKKNEALNGSYSYNFKDDASINISSKPYVYYLKNIGVVSGDNDNFNPNSAVTKAAMAVMLDKVLGIMDSSYLSAPPQNTNPSPTPSPVADINKFETVTGTIDKFYTQLNAVQILSADSKKSIYKMSASIEIYVDGFKRTPAELVEGMSIVGIVSNNELVDIKAQTQTASQNVSTPVSTPTPPPSGTSQSLQLSTLVGTVASANESSSVKTISIEIRMLNPRNEIIPEKRTYTLANGCSITRGDAVVPFSDITVGDVITAEVSADMIHQILLEEKNRNITAGVLTEKKYIEITGTPILSVKDKNGRTHDLRVTNNTSIFRKDFGRVSWSELRIGDVIDLTAEYDALTQVNATGVRSTIDGWVEEININKNGSSVTLKESDDRISKYNLILGTADPYSIKVGSKVRLRMDSSEVETITILEGASTIYVTGYIQSFKNDYFVLKDTSTGYLATKEIWVDNNTIIMDSKTGNKIAYSSLYEGNKIYVVLTGDTSKLARTITLLSVN